MRFLRVSRQKTGCFLPVGHFFLVLQLNVYQSALIPRKLPCPKKFLVTRLNRYSVLNASITKLPTKKLLWIFVLETIKTFILVFTWIERNSKLFLMYLCLYEWEQAYLTYRCIKFLKDSLACVILDIWGLHSSRLKQETAFSCQLKTWGSCLINMFNSLDSFFK